MQIAVEMLDTPLTEELHALFRAYYATTPAHTGLPEYDFDWPVYQTLQDHGLLLLAVARSDEGKLLGCAMYVVNNHLHHKGWKIAECDTLAVDHTQRGKGIGAQLVKFAEEQLRSMGVELMTHRYRTCYGAAPLFPKLGFELEEQVFMKRL